MARVEFNVETLETFEVDKIVAEFSVRILAYPAFSEHRMVTSRGIKLKTGAAEICATGDGDVTWFGVGDGDGKRLPLAPELLEAHTLDEIYESLCEFCEALRTRAANQTEEKDDVSSSNDGETSKFDSGLIGSSAPHFQYRVVVRPPVKEKRRKISVWFNMNITVTNPSFNVHVAEGYFGRFSKFGVQDPHVRTNVPAEITDEALEEAYKKLAKDLYETRVTAPSPPEGRPANPIIFDIVEEQRLTIQSS